MDFKKERKALVAYLKKEGITDKLVLSVMEKVPREKFLPDNLQHLAYENHALPIGAGQTISQPYTVAFMLGALCVRKGMKVLEIGTGSGYNAALLSKLVGAKGKVVTIEVVEDLVDNVKKVLKKFRNVTVVSGDGSVGYVKGKLYDRIIVTAACPEVNKEWIDQLKVSGILVAPIGIGVQSMTKIVKKKAKIVEEYLGYFQFVPLKGKKGF